MNNENHKVQLDNETTAFVSRSSINYQDVNDWVGERVDAIAYDENGNEINVSGVLTAILEMAYMDQ